MKSITTEACRNCYFAMGPYCARNPKWMLTNDLFGRNEKGEHWCGEFKSAWLRLGEPKGRGAKQVLRYAHRRIGGLHVFKRPNGECMSEEEYRESVRRTSD
jgi:hypothetical protein